MLSLTNRGREIILGSLLGDGSLKIHTPYRNARFSFRHSVTQKEYFWWKVNELKAISSDHCVWTQRADGFGGEKLRYQSRALESLTELFHCTHRAGRFAVQPHWLKWLTPLSLAIWWMDDGSLIANSRKGVFCTDGFTRADTVHLAKYLKKTWNVQGAVRAIRSTERGIIQYRLWIDSTNELKRFLRIILPHIPVTSMIPKVLLLYRDTQLQERWISEINRSSFGPGVVKNHLRKKKMKWQAFRE